METSQTATDLRDPRLVSALGRLEWIAARVVDGLLAGNHRSPYRGSSIEFTEHRCYSPGDELRTIDWRAFARRDRFYVKQYEDRAHLRAMLVIDATGSMDFGMRTVTKLRYAQMTAACLVRLFLKQADAVGLAVVGSGEDGYVPARSAPNHLSALLDVLERLTAQGADSLAGRLHLLARRLPHRGLVVVLSDCFEDLEPLVRSLHHLGACGHEVALLHTLAPEELTLDFDGEVRFEGLESPGTRIDLNVAASRARYLARVRAFLDDLRRGCGRAGADYIPWTTDQALGSALACYLSQRAARVC